MKIKARFEFEGELPKGLWWINDVDWGDEEVVITLEDEGGDLVLFLNHNGRSIPLITEFTGMEILGTLKEDA